MTGGRLQFLINAFAQEDAEGAAPETDETNNTPMTRPVP
jgi:hypothetical protein